MGFAALLAVGDRVARQQLGEPLVYTPGVGGPVTVQGIFEDAYVVADGGSGSQGGVSSVGPAAFFSLADLTSDPTIDAGATVARGAKTYKAHEVKPDGQGGVVMLLHLQ